MRALGRMAAAMIAAMIGLAVIVAVKSAPDIRRYLKIREM
jgi:hypothetical protein